MGTLKTVSMPSDARRSTPKLRACQYRIFSAATPLVVFATLGAVTSHTCIQLHVVADLTAFSVTITIAQDSATSPDPQAS
jgi:hypothetical protein